MTEEWLRTDEYGEVKDTLRACIDFSQRLVADPTYWKWLIIGIHNAVQGCMVIALTHSDGSGAITDKDAQAWRKAYLNDGPWPTKPEKLMRFLDLYDRIKEKGRIDYSNEHFTTNSTQDRSMKKLNDLRNRFIHFTPEGWSLELIALPQIICDCLEMCSSLIRVSGRFRIFVDYKDGELENLISVVTKNCLELTEL